MRTTSTSQRKSVSRSQRGISHKNNHFPRAKLARHLRCAALARSTPTLSQRVTTPQGNHSVWAAVHTIKGSDSVEKTVTAHGFYRIGLCLLLVFFLSGCLQPISTEVLSPRLHPRDPERKE